MAAAAALQLIGFAAIRRLGRVDGRMTALLAAAAVLLAFAAAWELIGGVGERVADGTRAALSAASGGRLRSVEEIGARLRVPERICRAGLSGRLAPRTVIAAKLLGVGCGALVAAAVAPAVGSRIGLVVGCGLLAAGFLAPDALLERAARRRRERLVAALPDALDMLAVGAASGRPPPTVFGEIAARHRGPARGRARRDRRRDRVRRRDE